MFFENAKSQSKLVDIIHLICNNNMQSSRNFHNTQCNVNINVTGNERNEGKRKEIQIYLQSRHLINNETKEHHVTFHKQKIENHPELNVMLFEIAWGI